MTDPDRARPRSRPSQVADRLARRRRPLLGLGLLLLVGIVGVVSLGGRGISPATAGSPALPSSFRPGVGIRPVILGEPLRTAIAALGRSGRQLVPGTLVYDRPGSQLAVGFVGDRVARILATGAGNPFGQRLAAEETTLSSWTTELCPKPGHLLLVAPGGHTYFVFPSAAAGLAAVGVSTRPVTPCGPLG